MELLLLQSRKSVHVNREIKPMNVDIVLDLLIFDFMINEERNFCVIKNVLIQIKSDCLL